MPGELKAVWRDYARRVRMGVQSTEDAWIRLDDTQLDSVVVVVVVVVVVIVVVVLLFSSSQSPPQVHCLPFCHTLAKDDFLSYRSSILTQTAEKDGMHVFSCSDR
ncbi:hypothetical protein IWZ03DRAFT_362949 [Phyllosticta citriasiana]|uniref:Uncharacterized protein n=1 Tax=Phyllosticta citriasiana TaxID=595635 RepID=A0ABR1KGT8_9PEZI